MLRCLKPQCMLCIGLMLSLPLANAVQTPKSRAKSRICVVAVQDSSLFTLCPPGPLPECSLKGRVPYCLMRDTGFLHIYPPDSVPSLSLPPHILAQDRPILDRSHADWDELGRSTQGIGPSGWLQLDLKSKAERELRKDKNYTLADSPDKADLVFLIEEEYSRYNVAPWDTRRKRDSADANRPDVGVMPRALIAVVLPADVYSRNPGDSEKLLDAKLWSGARFWQKSKDGRLVAPSPDTLVRQFLQKEKSTGSLPPICAAWTLPPTWRHRAFSLEPQLKRVEAGLPSVPVQVPAESAHATLVRVDVEMVNIPVVASDMHGKFVPDLTARDFRLFEDGQEQPIDRVIPEAEPFNVVLLMDISGSTRDKWPEIRMAAREFMDALRPDDRLMLISYGSWVYIDSEFTNDREQLYRAFSLIVFGGWSRLYDALDLTVTERLKKIPGRKAIVLLTDGWDTWSRLATAQSTLAKIEESDVLIYALQYDTRNRYLMMPNIGEIYSKNAQYLLDLCERGGGRHYNAETIPNLRNAFMEIAGELRHQYMICYYPTQQGGNDSYHRIRVEVSRPDVRIRARPGYRARARPGVEDTSAAMR